MMSVMDDTLIVDVVFSPDSEMAVYTDTNAYLNNEQEVWSHNLEAMRVDMDALNAFLELLAACDADYIDTQDRHIVPEEPAPMLDWESVSKALDESQRILVGVQELLSATLEEMGVEDHDHIRVYADGRGDLHLLVDHPRQEEIEAVLNSDENATLRELYQAATAGMSMAGGLVGRVAVPDEVAERVKEKKMGVAESAA